MLRLLRASIVSGQQGRLVEGEQLLLIVGEDDLEFCRRVRR
jgi:hypothetical protein